MTWHHVDLPILPTARVGFFGGTFDPPHDGHVNLVASAISSLRLEFVVVCPNAYPVGKRPLYSPEQRLALTERAMAPLASAVVVIEDEMPWNRASASPIRTYDTLRNVVHGRSIGGHPLTPGLRTEWFLLMGEDQAKDFTSWVNWEGIVSLADPVFLTRNKLDHSSTRVRERIEAEDWDKVRQLVPVGVYEMLQRLTPGE